MKLVRYGRAGAERPGIVDAEGKLRDLSQVVEDITPGIFQPAALKRLRETDTFTAQMAHFAECLQKGTRPIHSIEEGRAVLEVILAASTDADGWQKAAW